MRKDYRDYHSHPKPPEIDDMISEVSLMDVPRHYQAKLSVACEMLESYRELLTAMYLDSLHTDFLAHKEPKK